MNSNISVFSFESNSVRVVLINSEPWFVAKDVCEILEIKKDKIVNFKIILKQNHYSS